jgi:NAD(P)H-hydrate epimerase
MKIFTAEQIRLIDKCTIEQECITSIDLMERAAISLVQKFSVLFSVEKPVCLFAGSGNNGGDALAMARLLLNAGYHTTVVLIQASDLSADCATNLSRLKTQYTDCLTILSTHFTPPVLSTDSIIVDGLFGTGLTRSLHGIHAEAVSWINAVERTVVAIDIPSGLPSDFSHFESSVIVNATFTFSFQFPKLTFFLPENEQFVGEWFVLDIGLSVTAIEQTHTNYIALYLGFIRQQHKKRTKFQHKGSFGHLCLIAGSEEMAGAAVLSARAALRAGVGLVTVMSPTANRQILQVTVPEAIFNSEWNSKTNYTAIAIGPGLGTTQSAVQFLKATLLNFKRPMVMDADALNIISEHSELLASIPSGSILTPHPKEFDRLVGKCETTTERIHKAIELSNNYQLVVVLKGAHTLIALPDGTVYFNTTGNPGMATAGSGDVLTGMLGALLAQGYSSASAACLGVYLHGKAGDLALRSQSVESLIASDIIENIGSAFNSLSLPQH